jgi:hypothetical protein
MERGFGMRVAGILLFVVGLVSLLYLAYSLVNDLSIWVLGRHTEAEVLELVVTRTSQADEGELTFSYSVRYRFATPGGLIIVDTARVDVREWGALTEGGPIDVVYFPLYPQHNRIDESRYVSVLACSYVPFVLLAWGALVGGFYLVRPVEVGEWWFARRTGHEG